MKMNRIKKLMIGLLAVTLLVTAPSLTASAFTVENHFERGVPNLCYSRDTVAVTIKNGTMTSTGRQAKSGLFINLKGIPRISTSASQHVYDAKKEFLAGAKLGGVTIGYAQTITDRITVYSNYSASVRWGI